MPGHLASSVPPTTHLPVLTMVCGYSRWAAAVLIPSRAAEDMMAGWWQLIAELGAVPRALVWDGEGGVGRWRGGRSELTLACQSFRGTLATKVIICRPADPEAKGLVERLHDYVERSFLPGRTFTGPADFNTQISDWLGRVNTARGGRWTAPRPTGSPPTWPRCSPCRRSHGHRLADQHAAGPRSLRATAWMATITPRIPA